MTRHFTVFVGLDLVISVLCADPLAAQAPIAPSLPPGMTVRIATTTGAVTCRAMIHHADSTGLRLFDGSESPPLVPWSEVQWLWTETRTVVPRTRVPWGLVGAGVIVAGSAALVMIGRRMEGFAPLGLLAFYPVIWLAGSSFWLFGPNPPPGAVTERATWQPVAIPRRPLSATVSQADVARECPR